MITSKQKERSASHRFKDNVTLATRSWWYHRILYGTPYIYITFRLSVTFAEMVQMAALSIVTSDSLSQSSNLRTVSRVFTKGALCVLRSLVVTVPASTELNTENSKLVLQSTLTCSI
jgi:hypothetical protein